MRFHLCANARICCLPCLPYKMQTKPFFNCTADNFEITDTFKVKEKKRIYSIAVEDQTNVNHTGVKLISLLHHV